MVRWSACLFVVAAAAAQQSPVELRPMSSAEFCGRCHETIVEEWKDSAHARAMENRLFQDALELVVKDYGADSRKVCIGCHSPIAAQLGDWIPLQKVSWEGVTCDYCHSIRSVDTSGANPKAVTEYSLTKSGPWKDAKSSAHPTSYSPVHTSAALCGTCHNYSNAQGFPVLSTYSEWLGSSYAADNKTCQSCHMDEVAGDVVDPHIERARSAKINLHKMPGSRSVQMLNSTVKAQLRAVRREGQLDVTVDISNRGAGHYVPTGSPIRQLILEVRADTYAGQHYREERAYRRVVADASGIPIRQEHVAFLKAAKTLSDTRLAPGESRSEKFTFALPANVQADVTARFYYYYSPMAREQDQQQSVFLTLKQMVR